MVGVGVEAVTTAVGTTEAGTVAATAADPITTPAREWYTAQPVTMPHRLFTARFITTGRHLSSSRIRRVRDSDTPGPSEITVTVTDTGTAVMDPTATVATGMADSIPVAITAETRPPG